MIKKRKALIFFILVIFTVASIVFLSCRKNLYHRSQEEILTLNPQTTTLENGLKLAVLEKHDTPSVSAVLVIKAGSATHTELAGTGVAHFVEHMLFKGTDKYSEESIRQKFSTFGGDINAYTGHDRTAVHFSVLSQHFEEALDILADMVFNSSFSPEEVEKERQVILNEINLGLDNTNKRLSRELFSAVFRESLYRYPIIGHRDLFMSLTRDELFTFYKENYSPHNMVLSVVGDISQDNAKEMVRDKFGAYKRGRLPLAVSTKEPAQVSSRRVDVDFASANAKVGFAFRSVDIFDEDLFALDALSMIYGEMQDSILNAELVDDTNIAFNVDSYNFTPRGEGLFVINVECKPENVELVIETVKDLVDELKVKGVYRNDLAKAKNSFLTEYYQDLEANKGLAFSLAVDYALVGDCSFYAKYIDAIGKTTPAQIKKVARKYFTDSNLTIVVLSAESKQIARQVKPVITEKPVMKVLPGGLKVILREDNSSPLTSLRITYLGGLGSESTPHWGVSNLTADLLFSGTTNFKKDEITSLLTNRGAYFSSYSGNNTFGFSIDFLNEYTQDIFKLAEELIFEQTFSAKELEIKKAIIKASIEEQEFNVFQTGYLTVKKSLYTEKHPFYHSKLGEIESLTRMRTGDILRYYQEHLSVNDVVISVFGNFDTEKILPYLETISLKLSEKGKEFSNPKIPETTKPLGARRIVKYVPRKESLVMKTYKLDMGVRGKDRYILGVLTRILSGSSSRLYENIRSDRGLSYSLGTFSTYGLDEGFYVIYVETTEESTEEVEDLIEEQVRLLKETDVSDEELECSKNEIIGDFLRSLQINGDFSLTCSLDELYGFGFDFYNELPNVIRNVTAADIREIASKYLVQENSSTVIVLPTEY